MNEIDCVIWVHEGALWIDPAKRARLGENVRAIFIWDEDDFRSRAHSFKKLVFFYEALQEQNIEIIKGRTSDVLNEVCQNGQRLYYVPPNNPDIAKFLEPLRQKIDLRPWDKPTLGGTEFTPNMKRFFRYWNKAKRQIMKAQ